MGTVRRRTRSLFAALALLAVLIVAASSTATAAGPQQRAAGGLSPGSAIGGGEDPAATASVIGGHNATIAQYPSLAFIEGAVATAGYACTGTVVAPRVVLTAGHCVEDIESSSITQPEQIAVATGISNLQHIAAGEDQQSRAGACLSRASTRASCRATPAC